MLITIIILFFYKSMNDESGANVSESDNYPGLDTVGIIGELVLMGRVTRG